MSPMFEKIKSYYNLGLWNKTRVYNMVAKKVITKEEYEIITKEAYEE